MFYSWKSKNCIVTLFACTWNVLIFKSFWLDAGVLVKLLQPGKKKFLRIVWIFIAAFGLENVECLFTYRTFTGTDEVSFNKLLCLIGFIIPEHCN